MPPPFTRPRFLPPPRADRGPVLATRALLWSDLPEVLTIERASYAHPASEVVFRRALARPTIAGTVATIDGVIVGFTLAEHGHRTVFLHNLAVAPAARCRGVASMLLDRLVRSLSRGDRERIDAPTVREDALPAQKFLRARGFIAVPWAGVGGRYIVGDPGDEMIRFRYETAGVADTGCDDDRSC